MSLIYMNGFEWNSVYENIFYCTYVDWITGPGYSGDGKQYPRSGSYSVRIYDNSWLITSFSATSELYMQMAFNPTSYSLDWEDYEVVFLNLRTGPGLTVLGSISFNPTTLSLKAWSGFKGSLLGTSSFTLQLNKWYVLEFHWKFDNSTGVFESRIDGNADMSFSGDTAYTAFTDCTSLDFVGRSESYNYGSTSFYWQLDDVVVCDTAGSTNISWPNGARILLKKPAGKGSSSEWYKEPSSTIDNYQCVDGWPSIDPTEYVYTDLNAKTDLYSFPSLPAEANTVLAVRADAWAQKNSGTTMTMNLAIKPSGGSVDLSSAHLLNISYSLQQNVWEENPDTSSVWTPAEVNVVEAGFKSIVQDNFKLKSLEEILWHP